MADRETIEVNGWKGLLEALPHGVLHLAEDGRVLGANAAAARTLDLPLETLLAARLGIAPFILSSEEGRAVDHSAIFDLVRDGELGAPRGLTLRCQDSGGEPRWIELSIAKVADGGVLASLGDVTEARRARAVLEARARIVEKSAAGGARDLLQAAIDEAVALTGSRVGFCSCFGAEEARATFRAWSTNDGGDGQPELREALDDERLYEVALREGRALVAGPDQGADDREVTLAGGLTRVIVAPVIRQGCAVAMFVVANKLSPYVANDVESVRLLGDVAWLSADRLFAREALRIDEEALRRSEARLRAIFDAEPECVKLVSRDGILLDMNPAGLAMLEVDRVEEAIGKPVIGMVVQEYREGFNAIVRRVFEGESVIGEFEIVGRKGTRRWMETHAGPLRDEEGRISSMLAVTRDVTARRRVQESLRESEEKLRGLYELSPLGIALTDMDGRFVEFNEAFRRICGYSADELRHLDYWTLTPKEYEKEEAKQLESLAETERYGPYEKEYLQKNGRKVPVRLNGMLVSDRAGHRHIWSIVEDISAQRHFEEERRFVEIQLQRSQRLESLASLAGGVAHDMNNVLGAIESLAGVERDEAPAGSTLRESLDTIIRASERGCTLVRGLQGFARAGLAHEKQVDLNAVVRDETAILERTTLGKVSVKVDLDVRLRPVLGDAAALSHALMNLCMNAIEAMPEGGRLLLTTRNEGPAHIHLEVSDTGRGMSQDVQERAWDPFFTTKPHGAGPGLGLAIVYGAIKAHGGEVALQSEPGEGTTVSIRLPAFNPATREVDGTHHEASGARALQVLVVDDDELVQKSTARVLHAFGHEPTVVRSGEEALEILEARGGFDAIVLDLNMPGIGGTATLAIVRRKWPDIPVLLATGRPDQEAIDLARTTNRVTLLAKPFAPPALNEQLVALVERWPRGRG